jgi:hypothetical protein
MGKLGEPIMVRLVQELGDEWWQRKADVAGRIWEEIEKSLLNPDIPFQHARLYQDALPICGREYDIVQELAASGSRNHALLLRLIERGATIMGTESPELLIEEYRRVQRLLENPDRKTQMGARAPIDALIKQRDSFIAKRIESTLTGKEFGIVFLGMLHSITERLPADMRVVQVLPFGDSNHSRIRRGLLEAGLMESEP